MRTILSLLILVAIGFLIWLGWQRFQAPAAPWPEAASEHPFARSMDDAYFSATEPAPDAPPPAVEEATGVRAVNANVQVGARTITAVLEATPEVSDAWLDNLAATLTVVPFQNADRADLKPFYGERGKLLKGAAEVRLPSPVITSGVNSNNYAAAINTAQRVNGYYFAFPDNWVMVRPNVIAPNPTYSGDPMPEADDSDVGRATAALTGSWTTVRGQLFCQPPDAAAPVELPFVEVIINDAVPKHADEHGNFEITGTFTDVTALTVRYDGRLPDAAGEPTGPRISVMNDFHNPRSETFDIPANTGSGDVLVATLSPSSSIDCELFVTGAEALQAYHNITGTDPSAPDDLRIKRWEGIYDGTPHTYYDYVAVALNWRRWCCGGAAPAWFRRETLYHEFGHSLRHADDGDLGHWGWDNFRWAYARNHGGEEIFNEQYAFNEGWGQFWACTSYAGAPPGGPPLDCPDISGVTYRHTDAAAHPGVDLGGDQHQYVDWVEVLVGRRLVEMANVSGVTIADMAQLSRDNPGRIHTLRDFENVYCARFRDNPYCAGGRPSRVKTSCPPQYHDDGATCRLDNIIAKDSYGRGVGTVPIGCESGERDAGLCYEPCRDGFDGVGPVCWKRCPPGMHDDGAFCRRDVQIISSNNGSCPWYDVCGVTFARGCSTCPAGFQNDGCTCRVDAWIFAKDTYGRGAGELPTACRPGQEYDAGLCYPLCRPTYHGAGPVCWGNCPAGYADHGGTCYRDPQIIVKY